MEDALLRYGYQRYLKIRQDEDIREDATLKDRYIDKSNFPRLDKTMTMKSGSFYGFSLLC